MAATTKKYILALDQGTSSSRAILFNQQAEIVAMEQQPFPQVYPQPAWVEHDPQNIWETQLYTAQQLIEKSQIHPSEIAAIGITNQRETTLVWNKTTGEPIYNAIVWQDRRTAAFCQQLKEQTDFAEYVNQNTGLLIDSYFSGTKINWILDNVEQARHQADNGQLAFGTVDTWLLYKLTQGKIHATDYTNASRTLLYNIHNLNWDNKLLQKLQIPKSMLPQVFPSAHTFGYTAPHLFGGVEIPICGIAGDQQAALFGQACFKKGMAKNTYGTGCFMLMHTGNTAVQSKNKLITTLACSTNNTPAYALEGSVFIGGAAIQWLRDELHIIDDAPDSEYYAMKVPDTDGVYVVPAFTGLGAPHWDMDARGAILGITRGTGKAHIIRATLESLAYQSADVLNAMEADAGHKITQLRVDGGASKNNLLMQFQADMLNAPVKRPKIIETTALGAAYLAGLEIGFYTKEQITNNWKIDAEFTPSMNSELRINKLNGWQQAVERIKTQN